MSKVLPAASFEFLEVFEDLEVVYARSYTINDPGDTKYFLTSDSLAANKMQSENRSVFDQ
jgi:hypothetical protein